MALTIYGIPNCDTVKAARRWLDAEGIPYAFHDFRAHGLDRATVEGWLLKVPGETLLNRRGTTWRKLDADEQKRAENDLAGLLVDHPSLIKRPVAVAGNDITVGWTDAERARLKR